VQLCSHTVDSCSSKPVYSAESDNEGDGNFSSLEWAGAELGEKHFSDYDTDDKGNTNTSTARATFAKEYGYANNHVRFFPCQPARGIGGEMLRFSRVHNNCLMPRQWLLCIHIILDYENFDSVELPASKARNILRAGQKFHLSTV
jgi:hypothetical protein